MIRLHQEAEETPGFLTSDSLEVDLGYLIAAAPKVTAASPVQVLEFLAAVPRNLQEIGNPDAEKSYDQFSNAVLQRDPQLLPCCTHEDYSKLYEAIGYTRVGLFPYLRTLFIAEGRVSFTTKDIEGYLSRVQTNSPSSFPVAREVFQELLDRANSLQANAKANIVRIPELISVPEQPGNLLENFSIFPVKRVGAGLAIISLLTVWNSVLPKRAQKPLVSATQTKEARGGQMLQRLGELTKGKYIKALYKYYQKTPAPRYFSGGGYFTEVLDGSYYNSFGYNYCSTQPEEISKISISYVPVGELTVDHRWSFTHNHKTGVTSPLKITKSKYDAALGRHVTSSLTEQEFAQGIDKYLEMMRLVYRLDGSDRLKPARIGINFKEKEVDIPELVARMEEDIQGVSGVTFGFAKGRNSQQLSP